MKKINLSFTFLFATLLSTSSLHAITLDKSAHDFFESYQQLEKKYDLQLKDLFLDDAKISNIKYGDDIQTQTTMSGKKLKSIIEDGLKYAQAINSHGEYSQIEVTHLNDNRYQITANRYALNTCYKDPEFKLVIQKQSDQQFKIAELHESSVEVSQCSTNLEQDIPAKLKILEAALNKDLPKKLDRFTTLDRVSANRNTLSYHYILEEIPAENIDDKTVMMLEDHLNFENCNRPKFKEEMALGVELQHLFYDSAQSLMVTHVVNKAVCETFLNR